MILSVQLHVDTVEALVALTLQHSISTKIWMKMKMKIIEGPKVFLLLQICLSKFRSEKTNSSLKIAFFLSQIEFSLVFM